MTNDDILALQNFDNKARLFPLPDLVFFPFAVQALHVFEPRYRQLTSDALQHDRLLAPVLLKAGWEADYENRPEVYRTACLGRIISEQRLADGRYQLQLRGLQRVRIFEELASDKLYRTARVELLEETPIPDSVRDRLFRSELLRFIPAWCSGQGIAVEVFRRILQIQLPLGTAVDIVTFALPLSAQIKQELLEALDVGQRAESLIRCLQKNDPLEPLVLERKRFPPQFSTN